MHPRNLPVLSAAGILGAGGIAWWAQIGGFIFGIAALKIIEAFPRIGLSGKVRRMTQVKGSPRLQIIRPVGLGDDAHLYGSIQITEYEARNGARKLVSISRGFRKRLIRITVPPRIADGKMLRLRGLGKQIGTDRFGDLMLKVAIEQRKAHSAQ